MILLKAFSRTWIWTTLLVLLGAIVCIRLGIWQLDRLAQRRLFNAQVQTMRSLPALDLPAGQDLMTMEWRAVVASGTFDYENQLALRNQYYNDQYGYHLVTPLLLRDGEAVLVDRGWIPAEGNSTPADWRKYDLPGNNSIKGIIRLGQQPSLGGIADPTLMPGETGLDFWVYVNVDRIGGQLPYSILPVYIQLDPDPTRTEPPLPVQPELDLTEGPHQGYAIQWFTFSGLLIVGYPLYLRRQESRRR